MSEWNDCEEEDEEMLEEAIEVGLARNWGDDDEGY